VVTVRVSLREQRDASYDIVIGRGLLAELPALLARHCPAARYAVITDSHVAPLYAEALVGQLHDAKLPASLFAFPAGERNKTRDTWAAVSDRMLGAQLGRDGAVVALGGGVAGDVGGFVAATFHRGIPCVQVPTSLLAMIDSSIGGKTGVDAPAGKNLIGSFHQPRLVVADLDTLATLPAVQLAAGMAEALKHGAIADAEYFAFLERDHSGVKAKDPVELERVVTRSIEIKAQIVAQDERETGVRAVLNFGHTIGHAIEATTRFEVLHGEAVGIGMIWEARLGERLGVTAAGTAERLRRALAVYGLPTALPSGSSTSDLLAAMQVDKKARAGAVRFALPQAIGRMYHSSKDGWTVAPDPSAIAEILARSA
jgi:3-dehydroquinate synthase